MLTAVFGFLWARDATRDVRGPVPGLTPEVREVDALPSGEAHSDQTLPGYTRSRFLEASTVVIGAGIGAIVTLPALGFMVLPSFTDLGEAEVDLGPLDNFPAGVFVIVNYLSLPQAGEVSRRTVFVRSNGEAENGAPSFTILYGRCVHLGCPIQANGPIDDEAAKQVGDVALRPVLAQSFGCPCHVAQYDSEGNRTAGPPVRALDRYTFSIRNGRLILGELYAVGSVAGTGANARISRYPWSTPGTHVDGVEAWLYPIVPSQITG